MSMEPVDKQVHDLKATMRELVIENNRLKEECQRAKEEATAATLRVDEITQHDHAIDRDRCVAIAKIYQDAWNRLRDHEWRLEITLWSTFMIIIAVLSCGGVKAFGFELRPPQPVVEGSFLFWCLSSSILGLFILMIIGSAGLQSTFRHFEYVRDYYVAKATARFCERLKQDDTYHRWGRNVTTAKIVASVFITGALSAILWQLLPKVDNTAQMSRKVNVSAAATELLEIKGATVTIPAESLPKDN